MIFFSLRHFFARSFLSVFNFSRSVLSVLKMAPKKSFSSRRRQIFSHKRTVDHIGANFDGNILTFHSFEKDTLLI